MANTLLSEVNAHESQGAINNEVKVWSDLNEAITSEYWDTASELILLAKNASPNSVLYSNLESLIDQIKLSSNPLLDHLKELKQYEACEETKNWDQIQIRNTSSRKRKISNISVSTKKQWRILFVGNRHKGFFFLLPFIEQLKLMGEVEVRTLDTSAFLNLSSPIKNQDLPTQAKELIGWSDVVFLEWVDGSSEWIINRLPYTKKIVLRLHNYELLHRWPLTTDWGKVDSLISVSKHNLKRLEEVIDLETYGCKSFVLPNLFEHRDFRKPKLGDVSKVLGLCGFGRFHKRPDLALDLLELLQNDDPMWKLRLLGNLPDLENEKESFEDFWERAQPYIQNGTLTTTPWMSNPSSWFQRVGIILSCSDREGTHEACREGIASGSMGLIRNWPWAKNYGGNADMFPDSFNWDTISEAADYLNSFESSEQLLNQASLEQMRFLERENREELIKEFFRIVRP